MYLPLRGLIVIPRGKGVGKENDLEFPEGWGCNKKPSVGRGVWIFSGTHIPI